MKFEKLEYDKTEGIATIRLNRPEKLNAFSDSMRKDFTQALEDARQDEGVRALIITGTGRGFCTGSDVSALHGRSEGKAALELRLPSGVPMQLFAIEKPIIAAINGVAAGFGFDLTLACDFRIAAEDARMGDLHVKIGSVPALGCYMLPRLIGLSRAYQVLMLPELFSARQALEMGLVYQVVRQDQLLGAARELAQKLMAMPALTLSLTKRAITKGLENSLDDTIEFVGYARLYTCAASREFTDGTKAFLEKRGRSQVPSAT